MHSNYTKTSRNQVIQLVLVPSVVKIRLIFIKKDQYFYSGFTQSLNQKCFLDFLLLMLQIMFLVFLDSNFKDEPSIRILKTCSDCTATKIIILLVLRIYREKIMSEGVKLPEQAVVEQIENVSFQICRSPGCNGILSVKHTFRHHVFTEPDFRVSDNRRLQEQLMCNKTCEILKQMSFRSVHRLSMNLAIILFTAVEKMHYGKSFMT